MSPFPSKVGTQKARVNLSKIDSSEIDDYYRSKFNIRQFSICLDKLPYDELDKSKIETKHQNLKSCTCGCDGTAQSEEYYKRIFNLHDFQISLPRLTSNMITKRKFNPYYKRYQDLMFKLPKSIILLKVLSCSSNHTEKSLLKIDEVKLNQKEVMAFDGLNQKNFSISLPRCRNVFVGCEKVIPTAIIKSSNDGVMEKPENISSIRKFLILLSRTRIMDSALGKLFFRQLF